MPPQRTHTCDQCASTFATVGSLNRHVRTVHKLERDHKCGQCAEAERAALKRVCVGALPNVLIVHLKRFAEDDIRNRARRLNDRRKRS